MMPELSRMLLAMSGSLAASIFVKATATAGLALIGTRLARRSRAAVRHALLAAAFSVLLLLPAASVVAPPVLIAVADRDFTPPVLPADDDVPAPPPGGEHEGSSRGVPRSYGISLSVMVIPICGAGLALSLLPMALSWWKVRVLCRSALPWPAGKPGMDALAVEAGTKRHVELLLHEETPGPMTCGVFHPVIVLPADAPSWGADDLRRALMHELEHVRRFDWASHCLARLTCALYWFHPLVWAAWRELALEAERACDDAVLRRSEAIAYADQLVELARRVAMSPQAPQLGMADRRCLARRIGALLDPRQPRGRAGSLVMVAVCTFAGALVFGISPLRMVAAPQIRDSAASEFNAVSVKLIDRETGEQHSHETGDPGRLKMGGNLHRFIIRAYGITDGQIGGEPEWFKRYLYEIEAVSSGPATLNQKMTMLRAALADRFQLRLRREERDVMVYALEVAPKGPKFRELKPGEKLNHDSAPAGIYDRYFRSMEELTNALNRVFGGPRMVDRTVVDRTNLTREYNAHLRTVRQSEKDESGSSVPFPDLFHDMQSQMGLKLATIKAKMLYYVVEHAAPATPN